MNAIFFRTPVSVFEVLWAVAIAYFVVRTALLYSAGIIALSFLSRLLVIAASRPLGLSVADHPGSLAAWVYIPFAAMLSGFLITRGVPRSAAFRLAVGVVTYGLLQLVNLTFGFGPFGDGPGAWGTVSGSLRGLVEALLVMFSLQPVLTLSRERELERERRHRKHTDGKLEGGKSLVTELENKNIPDGELEGEGRPTGEPKGALLGENERWLLCGI